MDLSQILGGIGGIPMSQPSIDPPGSMPSSGASMFSKLFPTLLGAGTNILGSYLKTKQEQGPAYAQLAEHQHEFGVQQQNRAQEIARRNALFGYAAPGLLSNLGYSSSSIPQVLGALPNG